ncbi:guanine deaminase [Mycobacterium sp. NPDC003449]
MKIYRATVLDTPTSPFDGGTLRTEADAGIAVADGVIADRGPFAAVRGGYPHAEVVDLTQGVLLPGLVDTHVHFPQLRVIGALGMPLLDWLDRCALPEEARMADADYARVVATEFIDGLIRAGTTTALVFGAHFAPAVDCLFEQAAASGMRICGGLVVSDRLLRPELLTTPEQAHADGLALAGRWHRKDRLRYAVTPRFSLSTSSEMLESCAALLRDVDGALFTSHVNENTAEVETVRGLFPECDSYVDTYGRHRLLGRRSVLAHNVHPADAELDQLAAAGAGVAHCPSSNSALGSGLFPLRRHVDRGVRVALGTDVGAGTGFSLLREGLQASFMQALLGADGAALTAAHMLYLATGAGAAALEMDAEIGDLSVGKQFDAAWISPPPGTTLDVVLAHAAGPDDALAKVFALSGPADVRGVWVGGDRLR